MNEKLNKTSELQVNVPQKKFFSEKIVGDIFGGTGAMLVALPSAIAFGLIIYAPLGPQFSGQAAVGGILGTIIIGLLAALFGGTKRLISAPCAPAAAVLSVFVGEMIAGKTFPPESIPIYITLISFFSGLTQVLVGKLGGGRLIKYIPYPVVAGYLSGVGVLIFFGQLPKFFGWTGKVTVQSAFSKFGDTRWESIAIAIVTMVMMVYAPKLTKKIPATIIALLAGVAAYFIIGSFNSQLLTLTDNHFVIGSIKASLSDISGTIGSRWSSLGGINFSALSIILVPTLTLAVLLSIDTLKTCVVLDALTYSRHDSNKELLGQGLGNIASAMICGIPGAGTMGATLVNLNSGAKTQFSGVFMGLTALLVLLALGPFIAWIPYSALAGILMIVGYRMIDKKSFTLLKHHSTRFDFFCILAVVISAVTMSLIAAAGVGIAFAIILFLREQIRSSVIRRKVFGNQVSSKRIRLDSEAEILREKGDRTIIVELQGQLFFGTTDQLITELDPYLSNCKYVVLDMKRVQSVDYTAVHMLKQILARIKKQQGYLIISSVPLSLPTGQNVNKYLKDLGLTETEELRFFAELSAAIEWCEDEILREEAEEVIDSQRILSLSEFEFFDDLSPHLLNDFVECCEERSLGHDERIFEIGEESDEMYFIRRGMVKIVLPLAGGMTHHLITVPQGSFFGDMSFLDKGMRSAVAVTVGQVDFYVLSREKFNQVAAEHPELSGHFFERLAHTIANRLRQSNTEVKALQEN